jgi:hypothetical protein
MAIEIHASALDSVVSQSPPDGFRCQCLPGNSHIKKRGGSGITFAHFRIIFSAFFRLFQGGRNRSAGGGI